MYKIWGERMIYFVIVEQDGDTARLECKTLEEAQMVYKSFLNYGKCSDVRIEVKG
jgi:hypothetical protein